MLLNPPVTEQRLFDHGPILFVSWENDASWSVAKISGNIAEFIGYSTETLISGQLAFSDIIHHKDLDRVREELAGADNSLPQTFAVQHEPFRLNSADGANRWVLGTTRPERDENNRVRRYHSYLFDITRRIEKETSLRRNQERLDLAVKGADLGTWDWNVQTGEVVFNERWAGMLGYSPDETKPHIDSWKQLVHPADRKKVMRLLDNHLSGRTANYQSEHRLRSKTGQWIWIQDAGKVTERDRQGRPLRFTGIHQDITERKQAEQISSRRQEPLPNTAHNSQDFFWIAGLDGKILAITQKTRNRLGCDENELLGRSVLELHPAARRKEVEATLRDAKDYCPVPLQTKSGELITVETHVSAGSWNGRPVLFALSKDPAQVTSPEDQLARAAALLNGPAIIGLCDLNSGGLLEATRAFCEYLEFKATEVIGKTPVELGIMDAAAWQRLKLELLSRGTGIDDFETVIRSKNHTPLHVLISADILHTEQRDCLLFALISTVSRKRTGTAIQPREQSAMMTRATDNAGAAARKVKAGTTGYCGRAGERHGVVNGIERVLRQSVRPRDGQRHIDNPPDEIDPAFSHFNTGSPLMHNLFTYLKAVAKSPEPILIKGESGTGKELAARALHRLMGENLPWVAINVAGLDDMVFSDTLFGHVRGAYTGAESIRAGMIQKAGHGLLFLDEIGDLSPSSQVKLLRLLEEREYYPLGCDQSSRLQARIVAATNRNLKKEVAAGRFRRDLLHRLTTHHIEIPPLRRRPEDISLLLTYFIAEISAQMNKPQPPVTAELLFRLKNYSFPGNIRELRALVYDAMCRYRQGPLRPSLFASVPDETAAAAKTAPVRRNEQPLQLEFPYHLPTIAETTRQLIDEALDRSDGNQSQAARLLGISQQALNQRLKKRQLR